MPEHIWAPPAAPFSIINPCFPKRSVSLGGAMILKKHRTAASCRCRGFLSHSFPLLLYRNPSYLLYSLFVNVTKFHVLLVCETTYLSFKQCNFPNLIHHLLSLSSHQMFSLYSLLTRGWQLYAQFKFWAAIWVCLAEDLLLWPFMGAMTNCLLMFLFKQLQTQGTTGKERREVMMFRKKM